VRTASRRRLDLALLGAGAVVGGAIVAFGGAIGDAERVTRYWAGAELSPDGDAAVTEVLDYDFGLAVDRHGIYRTIPGLSVEAAVRVESASAPDAIAARAPHTFADGRQGLRLKVGDPSTTISGRHRYLLAYELDGLAPDGQLDWDPIGTEFDVPIEATEVHVVAPWTFEGTSCFFGEVGSTRRCTARQVEPGHLVVRTGDLDTGEGVSIESGRGAALTAAPTLPAPPVTAPPDPGVGLALPAAAAVTTGVGAALGTSRVVRRSGRERVGTGGAADAAWAGDAAGPGGEVRLDERELAEMATTDFAPPGELDPAQGGLVLAEQVRPEHKVAWLIQAAIDGAVELEEEGDQVRLVRKGALPGPLATAFGSRDVVELGAYDATFAAGWRAVGDDLDAWATGSDLWDPQADRRKLVVRGVGALVMVLGAVLAFAGGFAASRWGWPGIGLVVVGSLLGGGGFAALVRGWELRVRTPRGSGLWLRVESFRRFLHESEGFHAEQAAARGVLREYTAWAVALGEIDHWQRAVAASSAIPADAGLGYVHLAPVLARSTSAAATAPSSSGGGGGGSVGGGGGGGGGGSW
jgi:hypothetical protein